MVCLAPEVGTGIGGGEIEVMASNTCVYIIYYMYITNKIYIICMVIAMIMIVKIGKT